MSSVVCCEHNPCPDRPRRRLRRFITQPWRCPQCGKWWRTVDHLEPLGITAYTYSIRWVLIEGEITA